MGLVFNEKRLPILQDERKSSVGGDITTMRMYLVTLNRAFKNG